MESEHKPKLENLHPAVTKHVTSARDLLATLHGKANWSDGHPELQEAITELEMALNILTIKTGALL